MSAQHATVAGETGTMIARAKPVEVRYPLLSLLRRKAITPSRMNGRRACG